MSNERKWGYLLENIENSINNSKQTIKYFERAIINAQERNEVSYIRIVEWEQEFEMLNAKFIEVNGIDFEEAQNYVDASNNPDDEFNLDDYKKLKELKDKIDGEKFFIHQRELLIDKHIKVIDEINEWIDMQQQQIIEE